ncbi:FUSC family protein [Duganella sp. BJB488]|uniref:FUSC family protein n=1 Tax=unclassified Duganella TaxID=2636909 RepID=UPI000E34C55D|nr:MULTISPECIES: FUSC family protein [unclassified Duganella]RFP12445.1 FUSC family protein [Duganella sp. BJB489]RFP16463.1 FUSC family protein [Duganella sp. BJB488]RFP30809.1 FUSC family protein [Duganella sp. BJB480]
MNPPQAAATPTQDPSAAREAWRWLAQETAGWFNTEGPRWLFVARTMLASFSALWLAFRLGLDAPYTALATTVILALPSSGMVLEKAFYRFLGTLVGCSAALLLVALFPQSPPLLFVGVALWIALCTAGAAMHRNQQSYSFVLAGYTACMIAVPAIDTPEHVFTLAVTRVTEVGLGIICAAVVHDVVFPRRHSHAVMRTVQARYASFIAFSIQVLEQRLSPAETELNHLKFAADIAALESGRAAAFFEAGHARAHTRQLHAFNAAFMAVLTTFYTLHRLIHRLRGAAPAHAKPVLALIEPMHAHLAQAMGDELTPQRMAQMRARLAADTAAARAQLAADIDAKLAAADDAQLAANGAVPPERAQRINFDTAVELLERYARDMEAFACLYHGLTQEKRQQVSDPGAYSPKTPPAIVAASGFRAGVALLLTAAAWYWLAWPYVGNAILMATIFCALASSSPRPTAMVQQVLIGFLVATPLAFVTEFFLVARANDFPTLVIAALPIFALGSYLITSPRWAGVGIGICMFCATLVVPTNLMHYDVEGFISSELSLTMGVAVAYLMFKVVLPEHTMGQKDHVAAALWREAQRACTAPMYRLKRRFDNRVRDLLSQLNAASGPAPGAPVRAVVRQGLTLLELGHAVIELRQLIATSQPGPVPAALKLVVGELAAHLRAPSRAGGQAALQAILDAGASVRAALPTATPERQLRLQTALTDLHSIYTSLLDQITTGETADAA